jgi:acyl carrier protein
MSRDALIEWMRTYLSSLMALEPHEIDVDLPFERYGLDSTAAAGLSGELSERLGIELGTNVAYDHPTIAALADHVLTLQPASA